MKEVFDCSKLIDAIIAGSAYTVAFSWTAAVAILLGVENLFKTESLGVAEVWLYVVAIFAVSTIAFVFIDRWRLRVRKSMTFWMR
jgi:fructose-specific phosphotransferase system IIC component